MKKTFKHLLLLAAGGMLATGLSAQAPVTILDFSVLPQVGSSTGQTDSITLFVKFKLNKANQATGTVLWLGTARDSSNVFVAHPVFSTSGSTTTFSYNGISTAVYGYEIVFNIKVSNTQYNTYTHATLFVETTGGPTTRLYYNK